LWTSASYCPACPGWMPWGNYDSPQGYHTTYPLIEYFMIIDFTEVEHHQYTGNIPKMTIDVDLTFYYSGIG